MTVFLYLSKDMWMYSTSEQREGSMSYEEHARMSCFYFTVSPILNGGSFPSLHAVSAVSVDR